jgi:hypothetical protein
VTLLVVGGALTVALFLVEVELRLVVMKCCDMKQYLRQLRKAAGELSGMNTAQAGDLIENLGE